MGFRIQPTDVEVPAENPFAHDRLQREEPAEILTQMLRAIEGPCVLAVDAPWGAGKTTFLNMLAQHLRNREFPVVEFNAWKTDFTDDPFLALSQELTDGLREFRDGALGDEIAKVKGAAGEVLRRAVPGVIRVATAGILDVSPMMEGEIGKALASYAQQRLSAYLDTRSSLEKFGTSLTELATELTSVNPGRPLIVVIGEMDRCRPSYAVELLETAKHLFSVNHVVFVLAVNRSELAHSIRVVYGSGFDAEGYLRRFFDIDFRLPDSDRRQFIDETLKTVGIENFFGARSGEDTWGYDYESTRDWLTELFVGSDLSLRRIAQAIHRLGLVFASLRRDRRSLALPATVALALRTLDRDLYERFTRRKAEDREVVEFFRSRSAERKTTHIRNCLEAIIIVAAKEIRNPDRKYEWSESSELLANYRKAVSAADRDKSRDKSPSDAGIERAREVVRLIDDLQRRELSGHSTLGFMEAVRRMELLSPSLIDEDTERSDNDRTD